MNHPLQLRQATDAAGPVAAWFLPGDSVARWLVELAHAGLAEPGTRLYLVARSPTNTSPAGLLVIPESRQALRASPAGLPCRIIAERLILPVDAVLHPPLTEAEVRGLFPLPVTFFHPTLGPSGFEESATVRVWDLIDLPDERVEDWNHARAGEPPLPALQSIVLAQPPGLSDVFGEAAKSIGTDSPKKLPPMPGEPASGALADSGRYLQERFARGVVFVTGLFPYTAHQRTWLNDVEDWATQRIHGLTGQFDEVRHQELHRLLKLLENDPEAGLRHAIPLNDLAHRGKAPPGGRLDDRPLDFDPRRLGGGPADFWNVPVELEARLRQSYRELANRELQLGRARRAAYIFAILLGDLPSAAAALKQGRLFREAAVLYEEQLHNPVEAANCLAEGGLLTEAIKRFEKLGRWLDVAQLHERLGQTAAAHAALRRVVDERVKQQDFLGAAKLLEERLLATDEALALLLGAWPESPQAANCLGQAFQLLGRHGLHELALEQLGRLQREPLPSERHLPLLNVLGTTARGYPEPHVRQRAADGSLRLIAGHLARPGLGADDARSFTDCLVRLAPEDRLLARDANRHIAARRAAELHRRRTTPPPLPGRTPRVLRRFDLPAQIEWLEVRTEGNWFYALGVTAKRLTVLRGIWEGEFQSLSWECPREIVKGGMVFEPTCDAGNGLALAPFANFPLEEKTFPAADLFFNRRCVAGTPAWLPAAARPFAIGEDGAWSIHVAGGQGILSVYTKRGELLRTMEVTAPLLESAERGPGARLCLVPLQLGAVLALGNRLVHACAGAFERHNLPGPILRLQPTLPHTRPGVVALLEHGAHLHWRDGRDMIELERDLAAPRAAFVHGGPLVLLSGTQAVLLDVTGQGVKTIARFDAGSRNAIAICPTATRGQFAVFDPSGQVTIFQAPD